MRKPLGALAILVLVLCGAAQGWAQEMSFERPPDSDRPWVYWFWKNGNISKEGITADLESMQRVGIGGVIMMEVSLSVPPGPYKFFSPEWRQLFKFAVEEANRLGLSFSMNSAPGWTGSGGPWVTPEQSMQKVVFSETAVTGPARVDVALPQPEAVQEFYRDIAVLAFPTPASLYRIKDIGQKALYERGAFSSQPGVRAFLPSLASYEEPPKDSVIPLDKVVDVTRFMTENGQLTWDAPEGNWTVLRIGHTSTGQTNRPAPLPGLECDKLDKEALQNHFDSFITVFLNDIDPQARKALVSVHLDSWEVGAQNWSRHFREEFQQRRGYDLLPYMPVMNARVVESLEVSERFLWDLRQTVSELIVENHGRELRRLAQEKGLWFSVEPYDMTPCDDMTLGATGDVPMCEFWSSLFDTKYSVKEATSVAHVYDRPVVAAEAFTSIDRWLFHPGMLKAQGDWAFCEGINRFVIHRYIHQPFPNARPGLSLGPHGLHYERTEPWWEYTRPWHEYLARCQHVLRQGLFVSDILYLSPEGAPNVFLRPEPEPKGYKYDACTPEALLTRVTAEDRQLVLPNGARYRLLVLPKVETMTPALLAKVRDLVQAGVPVVGMPARKSPSLSGYPGCDAEVEKIASEVAGHTAPARYISPENIQHKDPGDALTHATWIWHPEDNPEGVPPPGKRYFRRTVTLPENAAIVSAEVVITADNGFTLFVNGKEAGSGMTFHELFVLDVAKLLHPGANHIAVVGENGGQQPNAAGLVANLTVKLEDGSEIVVLTDARWKSSAKADPAWPGAAEPGDWANVREVGLYGMPPWGSAGENAPRIPPYPLSSEIEELLAGMGVLPDFAADAPLEYVHRQIGPSDVYFVCNGKPAAVAATCTFRVADKQVELWQPETGRTRFLKGGTKTADGRTALPLHFEPLESYFLVFSPPDPNRQPEAVDKPDFPAQRFAGQIAGSWAVAFDPEAGGPKDPVTFEDLADWSQRPEEGIRYYTGGATYAKTIEIPAVALEPGRTLYLDLGRVEVMASVKVNGKDVGIAWKQPYRVDITGAAVPGLNTLEIRVVNLWPNRLIGDENLPPDSDWEGGKLNAWPQWLLENKPSPTGRHSFATWKHWKKDDALVPSGLLGPVTLVVEK